MTTIHKDVAKRAIFEQEFRSVIETLPVLGPVATKLVSKAKNIQSPYTSVTAAKAHTQACRIPVGTLTVSKNELVLDRKIGNAIKDCEEELSYANFDIIGNIRGDLYASVMKKFNTQMVADVVADATVVASTEDLSTAAKVQAFLVSVAANAESSSVGLKSKVDGATVVRGEKHGKPFVAAGVTAFTTIVSSIASLAAQSSLKGLDGSRMIETPYGVTVINLGAAADNAKRLIWGTGGAITMAFRDDQIEVGMGEMVNTVTYDDGESGEGDADLDISHGDAMLEKTWYIYAQTKGKNGIFSDVQALVSTRLMA
jgi:hypothetical protein